MNFFTNKKIKKILGKAFLALVLVGFLGGVVNIQKSYAQANFNACIAAGGTPQSCTVSNSGALNNAINNPTNNTATGPTPPTSTQLASNVFSNVASAASDFLVTPIFTFIGWLLMGLSAAVLSLSGFFFDHAVQETILKMATRINTNEAGIGVSIDDAWKTLRDIANMFFILVLLFTAFKAMFELSTGNVGKTILNIIIVALLINFSLFFTKVVIDASNVVAVGFYNSIVSSSRSAAPATEGTQEVTQASISSGYMRLLGLQSWFDAGRISDTKKLTADKILITGVFSSIFMLVTAVILFIMAIMLVARWVILVFLMILSPVAFIALIIPGMSGQFEKWKNALIDQSFFAPLFFAMTWVTFRVAAGLRLNGNGLGDTSVWYKVGIDTPQTDTVGLIFNYFIIMGFAVASLIFAKQMASKTAYFTSITGTIGAGVAGASSWGLRTTVGRAGNSLANKMQSAKASNNFATRNAARFLSYTGEKAAKSSFDIRNAAIPTSVVGDAIRGTIGRTSVGKKLGLNDVNIQSIDVGNKIGGGLVGTADKKGYAERKAESDKRVGEREAKEKAQIKLATATNNILAGAKAAVTNTVAMDQMEKSLTNLSEKEIETLVANNNELLESQNFANKISVKQLDAIVKSDQISSEEKAKLKNIRFSDIEKGVASGATQAQIDEMEKKLSSMSDKELEILAGSNKALLENQRFADVIGGKQFESLNKSDQFSESEKTKLKNTRFTDINAAMATGTPAAITAVKGKIKNLSDYELETIDTSYLKNEHFVSELRPAQAEAIIKSNKFNTTQKNNLRDARKAPLVKALDTAYPGYAANPSVVKDMITKKLNPKDVAGLMTTNATFVDHTGATVTKPILTHPEILNVYNVGLLKRMAPEMSAADIQILRDIIEDAGTTPGAPANITKLATWLHTPDGAVFS